MPHTHQRRVAMPGFGDDLLSAEGVVASALGFGGPNPDPTPPASDNGGNGNSGNTGDNGNGNGPAATSDAGGDGSAASPTPQAQAEAEAQQAKARTSTSFVFVTATPTFTGGVVGYTTLGLPVTITRSSLMSVSLVESSEITLMTIAPPVSSASEPSSATTTFDPSGSILAINTPTSLAVTSAAIVSASASTIADSGPTTSGGKTTGAKAGLAIGIIALFALICGLIIFYVRRKRHNNRGSRLSDEKFGDEANDYFAAHRAHSIRGADANSKAPRISLKPIPQFLPRFGTDAASGVSGAVSGRRDGGRVTPPGNPTSAGTSSTSFQRSITPNNLGATGTSPTPWERSATANRENPFGNHAEVIAMDPINTAGARAIESTSPANFEPLWDDSRYRAAAAEAEEALEVQRRAIEDTKAAMAALNLPAPSAAGKALAKAYFPELSLLSRRESLGRGNEASNTDLSTSAAGPSSDDADRVSQPSSVRAASSFSPTPIPPTTNIPNTNLSSASAPPLTTAAAGGSASTFRGGLPPDATVHRVQLDFSPTMADELRIRAGQLVRILHKYDDGWALCANLNERATQGVVPRTCLSARPVQPKLRHTNIATSPRAAHARAGGPPPVREMRAYAASADAGPAYAAPTSTSAARSNQQSRPMSPRIMQDPRVGTPVGMMQMQMRPGSAASGARPAPPAVESVNQGVNVDALTGQDQEQEQDEQHARAGSAASVHSHMRKLTPEGPLIVVTDSDEETEIQTGSEGSANGTEDGGAKEDGEESMKTSPAKEVVRKPVPGQAQ